MKMYYTDPLKASWMAREFGVKFFDGGLPDEDGDFYEIGVLGCLDEAMRLTWNKIYLTKPFVYTHPDSMHIFEPKVGDVVLTGDNDYMEITYDVASFSARHGFRTIIQRDNKAFFWPEVEA